nr:hypothetical protein [Tanacetum cinerariifolium]
MWHDSSVDKQIEIERLRKQILKVFHPYISVSSIQNIGSDGNCGFRAVALGLGPPKDQWPQLGRICNLLLVIEEGDHGRWSSGVVGFVVCVARETGQLPSVFWKGSLTQVIVAAEIGGILARFSSLPLHILFAWIFMSQDAKRCHPLAMVHNSNTNGSTSFEICHKSKHGNSCPYGFHQFLINDGAITFAKYITQGQFKLIHAPEPVVNTYRSAGAASDRCTISSQVVENKYLSNQAKFCNLYIMVKVKVEAMKENGCVRRTNAVTPEGRGRRRLEEEDSGD